MILRTIHKSKPLGVAVLSILTSAHCAPAEDSARASAPSDSETPAAALRQFLASKHETGELTYTWRFPNALTIPGTSIRVPDTPAVFKAKWQPGSYVFMQLESTNALVTLTKDQVGTAVGKAGGQPWVYENGYLHRYEAGLSAAAAATLSSRQDGVERQLACALGFGIPYVPGSLKWDGTKFSATGSDGRQFEGELLLSGHGIPDQFLIPPASLGPPQYRIQLSYNASRSGSSLPIGYDYIGTLPDGASRSGIEVRILSISTTNAVLPESEFQPETVLTWHSAASSPGRAAAEKPWFTIVHSNRQDFYVRSNRLVPMPDIITQSRPRKGLVVVALLGTSLAFAAFFLMTRKKNQSNTNLNERTKQL